MFGKWYKVRSGFVFLFFFLGIFFLGYRLFAIQVLGYTKYAQKANKSHQREIPLMQKRGDVCDRNGNVLAMSISTPSLYADPQLIKDTKDTISKINQVIKLDKKDIDALSDKEKRFVLIKRRLTKEEKEKISAFKFSGINFAEEPTRFYPKGKLAVHVLGFVNIDSEGMEGIELICDKYLKGTPGYRFAEVDAKKREVISWRGEEVAPVDGYKIILTIDEVIQYIVEDELDKAMENYHPKAGMCVVMDPNTGEILALANRPNYDPNKFKDANKDVMRNRIITDCFEPGSVFKMFVAGAALNEKLYRLSDVIFCENGAYPVPGGTLHDSSSHGNLTFQQVVEKSSNIGMAKVGQKMGQDRLYKYLTEFGFGKKTDIMFPGEVAGILYPPKRWSGMSITRIPMGQEVAVTAIQLAVATSAIANGGKLLQPSIVKRIVDNANRTLEEFNTIVVKDVITKDAADKLTVALKGVVSPEGTAQRAKINEFSVAGKTGTAQKLNPDGTYSHEFFMASFIGFVPANKPRVVIAVMLDSPRPIYYGGVTAAPVFKSIAEKVLGYLNVEPEFGPVETLVTGNTISAQPKGGL
jgi:cell division protein FtsI (penicillin-binding protein 3)